MSFGDGTYSKRFEIRRSAAAGLETAERWVNIGPAPGEWGVASGLQMSAWARLLFLAREYVLTVVDA
jgi:hypothetical protein